MRKTRNEAEEIKRLEAMSIYEQACYAEGFHLAAGIDEAGRGPLAGPVVACALVLPYERLTDCFLYEVNDSKKLSPKKREMLCQQILEHALSVSVAEVDWATIDHINILKATHLAMEKALLGLDVTPGVALVDGYAVPTLPLPQKAIVQGDAKSVTIAAASIVAKVKRDAMMQHFHEQYPQYGFNQHKGYCTKAHVAAIKAYGPCPIHRKTFLKRILAE